ncbi:Diguanylate cyclase [Roseomonas mucosa]|nr:Diguanylate cyclase [Roseomonas mucosa]
MRVERGRVHGSLRPPPPPMPPKRVTRRDMFLDAPTLILAVTLVTGTSALACLMSWRASPGHDLPLIFGGAFLSETLAMALQFDRSALPLLVTVDLSNALAILCSALIWAGHRRADGRATPVLLILLAPLVWLLACRIPEFYGRYDRRVLLASLLHGGLFAVAAWELWRGRAERISARWWMFAAMVGSVAVMAFRGVAMLVSPDPVRFHFLPDLSLGLVLVSALVFFVLHGFGAVTMIRERAEAHYRREACSDPLTGLPNRRRFDQAYAHEFARARHHGRPLSVLMIDADHFKAINDHHGHPEGDACLRRVANVLQRNLRDGSDLAARLGGEEFAVLLPGTGLEAAMGVAERIRRSMRAQGIPHPTARGGMATLSLGVAAMAPGQEISPRGLLEAADRALYAAKREGRDLVRAQAPDSREARPASRLRSRPDLPLTQC